MDIRAAEISSILKKQIKDFGKEAQVSEIGQVLSVGDGIARIYGLKNAESGELVTFEKGVRAIVLNLEEDNVGAVLLGSSERIREGDSVKRTKRIASIGVGEKLLGRVINTLGVPLDGKGPIETDTYSRVEMVAPGVIARKSVHEPCYTGLKAIDAMTPVGRGQRELIIGDRQIGKTAVAIDAILAQKDTDVYCIYVASGQKKSSVAQVVNVLEKHGAMEYTTVIAACASDPATLQYLGPYAGTAMGEYFRDKGQHALIIYDDLSKQAVAYRELSLLLRRPLFGNFVGTTRQSDSLRPYIGGLRPQTSHRSPRRHRQGRRPAGQGLRAGSSRLGRGGRQSLFALSMKRGAIQPARRSKAGATGGR